MWPLMPFSHDLSKPILSSPLETTFRIYFLTKDEDLKKDEEIRGAR